MSPLHQFYLNVWIAGVSLLLGVLLAKRIFQPRGAPTIPNPPPPPDSLLAAFPPLKRIDYLGKVFVVSHHQNRCVVAEYVDDHGRVRTLFFNRGQLSAILAASQPPSP